MFRIKRLSLIPGLVSAILMLIAPLASAAEEKGPGLVDTLVSQLGVTKDQAAGGAGSILGYAKGNMKKEDFKKVTAAVPETKELIKAAPKADAGSSVMGSLGSAAGGSVGTAAALTGSFEKLGLKSDMVGKFVPIVVNYAQSKGGSTVGTLLSGALGLVSK
jgi:hypothetical protein